MKKWIFAVSLALACVSSEAATTKYHYGWRSEAAGADGVCLALDTGLSTQVCTYAPDKTIWFRITGSGMDPLQRGFLNSVVDNFNNLWVPQFSGLALGRTNGDAWDMRIDFGTVSGGDLTKITAYANVTCLTASTIYAENPAAQGVHRPCIKMGLIIDYAKIDANFDDPDEAFNVIMHALAGGMMHGIGLGWTDEHSNRWTSTAITAATPKNANIAVKDVCRVNAWNPSDATVLNVHSPARC